VIAGVFVGLVFAALAALVLQVVDAIGAVVDAVNVRDSDEPDALTRTRLRELGRTLALTATLAVLVAYAVDRTARLAAGESVVVLLLTTLAVFGVGGVGVFAVLRRERPTYARLRRDLRDRSTFSLDTAELEEFEARLARADRLRARRPRAALGLRILGVVLVAATAVLTGRDDPALVPFGVTAVAVDAVAFAVAVRAGAVYQRRLEVVLDAQRAEVAALLERARIPQRGSVPGLRDRVSRALAILREKQR
jgi:hypothetical protein